MEKNDKKLKRDKLSTAASSGEPSKDMSQVDDGGKDMDAGGKDYEEYEAW